MYLEDAIDRESWTKDKWDNWQQEKLIKILNIAYKHVPYYKEYWRKKKKADNVSHELIENWPIINKKIIQKNPKLFINEKYNKFELIKEYTSGSTGSPMPVYQSKDSLRYWYSLCESRWFNWYDSSMNKPWANLAGRKIVPYNHSKPPFWVWSKGLNQLYLSCYHLNEKNIKFYFEAMKKYKITYLYGLASSLNQLAILGEQSGIKIDFIKVIVSCAENLYPNFKKNIEKFFNCKIFDSYGSTEKVIGASECMHNNMHLWPDAGKFEILSNNKILDHGISGRGRLICTNLFNYAMPLIRYNINDVGKILFNQNCDCKINMPILDSLDGRYDDMITTQDGRKVMIIWSFLNDLPIIELQIIQQDIKNIYINFIPGKKFTPNHKEELVSRLKNNIGKFNFHLNPLEKIPKNNNGKFKAVISKL